MKKQKAVVAVGGCGQPDDAPPDFEKYDGETPIRRKLQRIERESPAPGRAFVEQLRGVEQGPAGEYGHELCTLYYAKAASSAKRAYTWLRTCTREIEKRLPGGIRPEKRLPVGVTLSRRNELAHRLAKRVRAGQERIPLRLRELHDALRSMDAAVVQDATAQDTPTAGSDPSEIASSAGPAPVGALLSLPQVTKILAGLGETRRDGEPLSALAVRSRMRSGHQPLYAKLRAARDPGTGMFRRTETVAVLESFARTLKLDRERMRAVFSEIRATRDMERGGLD